MRPRQPPLHALSWAAMKLCAISPQCSNRSGAKPKAVASALHILDFLATCRHDLVLLPGSRENTPTPTAIQQVLAPGVHVFVESSEGSTAKKQTQPWVVTADTLHPLPKQLFAQNPSQADVQALGATLTNRTVQIAGRQVTFILCGEINGFNKNGLLKHGSTPTMDIIAHPTHTPMGRWHVLGTKLAALSQGGTVLHAANNDKGPQISTDVRIYQNGQRLPVAKNSAVNGLIGWMECLAGEGP